MRYNQRQKAKCIDKSGCQSEPSAVADGHFVVIVLSARRRLWQYKTARCCKSVLIETLRPPATAGGSDKAI